MTPQTDEQLSEALHDLVATQPFVPDPTAIERRGLRLRRRATAARAATAAAVVVVAVTAIGTIQHEGTVNRQAAAKHPTGQTGGAVSGPLVHLADHLQATPLAQTGDATLIMRSNINPGTPTITVADLYADNGKYYFSQTRSGLSAQVSGGHTEGNGFNVREVAAAIYATTGDLAVARERMADSALPDSVKPPKVTPDVRNNWVLAGALDALITGAGNAQVRAGVLRILSTLPDISVRNTTTNGLPTLTITAGPALFQADYPATSSNFRETLTIDARTGIPLSTQVGHIGDVPVTESYQVSRVTLSGVAAGKF
jgi:hypothetical protein